MQIGRITGLPELLNLSQPDMSTIEFDLLVNETQARQLIDLGSNTAERFVPILSTSQPDLDGIYQLLDVSAGADPNTDAAGLRAVSVTARGENRGRQVANAVLSVRGDNRWVNSWNGTAYAQSNTGGCTGPLYRVAIPDPATSIQSFNAGAAGYAVEASALSTMRGSVRRLTDNTQVKQRVAVATTANITLSGTQTVDGFSVSTNDTRVLVKNQTTASQNGIYTKQTGAWTRATDADGGTELDYAQVGVEVGTVNGGTSWFLPQTVTIGTTAQTWRRSPQAGLRENSQGGPVVLSYQVALADWYNGACTITQGSNVVTGLRLASSGTVVMDNGLIRAEYGTSGSATGVKFSMATGSPLAWGVEYFVRPVLTSTAANLDAPSIISNTAELVVMRFRFVGGSIDIAMRRGSRTMTVAFNLPVQENVRLVADRGGVDVFDISPIAPLASPVGFVNTVSTMTFGAGGSPEFWVASTNDSDGNRLGLTTNARQSGVGSSLSSAYPFGLHAIIGGGTTYTGNDQLYGMAREWYGMASTQTSAGVL